MKVEVALFGNLADVAGCGSVLMDFVSDTTELQQKLVARYPALANKRFVIAVDKEVVKGNTTLQANSTIALLPPFSGG